MRKSKVVRVSFNVLKSCVQFVACLTLGGVYEYRSLLCECRSFFMGKMHKLKAVRVSVNALKACMQFVAGLAGDTHTNNYALTHTQRERERESERERERERERKRERKRDIHPRAHTRTHTHTHTDTRTDTHTQKHNLFFIRKQIAGESKSGGSEC